MPSSIFDPTQPVKASRINPVSVFVTLAVASVLGLVGLLAWMVYTF